MSPKSAPEAITKAVASLPPEQMLELMKQMKVGVDFCGCGLLWKFCFFLFFFCAVVVYPTQSPGGAAATIAQPAAGVRTSASPGHDENRRLGNGAGGLGFRRKSLVLI